MHILWTTAIEVEIYDYHNAVSQIVDLVIETCGVTGYRLKTAVSKQLSTCVVKHVTIIDKPVRG